MARDADPYWTPNNAEAVVFTRRDPDTGELAERLTWCRRVWPDVEMGVMVYSGWWTIRPRRWSNARLLDAVAAVPPLLDDARDVA